MAPEEPMAVVRNALADIELLIATYVEPGLRSDPGVIVTQIGKILEDPKLCKVVGIGRQAPEWPRY